MNYAVAYWSIESWSLPLHDAVASLLSNDNSVFKWKLSYQWPNALWRQRHISLIRYSQVDAWWSQRTWSSLVQAEVFICSASNLYLDTLRPRQSEHHFADDFLKRISGMKMHEFRLKFLRRLFLRVQLTILPTLVQIMAWCHPGESQYLNQWWLIYRYRYASLGFSEFKRTYCQSNHRNTP